MLCFQVKQLVEQGAAVNDLLSEAVDLDSQDLVQFLIEADVDVNHLLSEAAALGPPNVIQFLIEKGCNAEKFIWRD